MNSITFTEIPIEKINGLVKLLTNDFCVDPEIKTKQTQERQSFGLTDFWATTVWNYDGLAQLGYSSHNGNQILTLSFPKGTLFDRENSRNSVLGVLTHSNNTPYNLHFGRRKGKSTISNSEIEVLEYYFSQLI